MSEICPNCKGSGRIRCKTCGGSVMKTCPMCRGKRSSVSHKVVGPEYTADTSPEYAKNEKGAIRVVIDGKDQWVVPGRPGRI